METLTMWVENIIENDRSFGLMIDQSEILRSLGMNSRFQRQHSFYMYSILTVAHVTEIVNQLQH